MLMNLFLIWVIGFLFTYIGVIMMEGDVGLGLLVCNLWPIFLPVAVLIFWDEWAHPRLVRRKIVFQKWIAVHRWRHGHL